MPWTVADVDKHRAGLTQPMKAKWVAIANSALASTGDEAQAIKIANAAFRTNELVINEAAGVVSFLTANMSKLITEQEYQGKSHYVVPVVLMVEGVHNGILYRADDLAKTPAAWDGRPIPVNHPLDALGNPISCNQKEILETMCVGILLNTRWENGKLKSDAWVDKEKADTVDPRVIERLANNIMMEVSTGLFTDTIVEEGEWNGEKYNGIAINYRPDHLALLLDTEGACSIQDGAGMPRINENTDAKTFMQKVFDFFRKNEQSHNQIHRQLNTLLGKDKWVVEVFNSNVVYEDDTQNGKLFRSKYEVDGETVKLVGVPEMVVKKTDYVVANESVKPQTGESAMEELINSLIANASTQYGEDDREWLRTLSEDQLKKMTPVIDNEQDEEGSVNTQVSTPAPKQATGQAPVANQAQGISLDDIRKVVREEMRVNNAKPIVEKLIANKNCQFSRETLEAMSEKELKSVESMLTPNNFAGRGPSVPLVNAAGEPQKKVPDMPRINWAEKSA